MTASVAERAKHRITTKDTMIDLTPLQQRTGSARSAVVALAAMAVVGSATAAADVRFTGMCDASGAIPLSTDRFAVADDEDNLLRIYDAETGGAPLGEIDISRQLGVESTLSRKGRRQPPAETDIEAATTLNGRAYWITSHGRDSRGEERRERLRFFTTTIPDDSRALAVTAVAPESFFEQLLAAPQLRPFDLPAAAMRAPKTAGGLNIEGLAATPDGGLLIGFRSPIPDGLALLVVLENPEQTMAGEAARFSEPIRLDLGGLGVRALSLRHGRYLIAAGHHDSGGESRLYAWNGVGVPEQMAVDLRDFKPEGYFQHTARRDVMLLSDDGGRMVGKRPCKRLKKREQKYFRGRWVSLEN